MDVNNLFTEIEQYKEFLTVNEIDKKLFKLCESNEIIQIGLSDMEHKILSAKLGEGKDNVLIFGFPHSNEPIGSLSCLSLIKLIKKNKKLMKKYTWYIVPCADPDGAKLNEGWFKGKFSIKKYAYNFYRTQSRKQTDWTFPIEYNDYRFNEPPKNTQSLAMLIKKIKPILIYPLHNAGFSGAFFFITKKLGSEYYKKIINLCNELEIPLDLGEPEMPFMQVIKKPIYSDFGLEEIYDYFQSSGQNPIEVIYHGTDSIGYAKKYNKNVFGLVGEVPYIYDAQIENQKLTCESRESILKRKYEEYKEIINFIEEVVNLPNINKKSLFYSLLKDVIQLEKSFVSAGLENLKNEEYKNKASNSEKFSSEIIGKFYASLILGECRRLLLDSNKSKERDKFIVIVEGKIEELVRYINEKSNYDVIPINNLVKLQLGCLFISLNYLN